MTRQVIEATLPCLSQGETGTGKCAGEHQVVGCVLPLPFVLTLGQLFVVHVFDAPRVDFRISDASSASRTARTVCSSAASAISVASATVIAAPPKDRCSTSCSTTTSCERRQTGLRPGPGTALEGRPVLQHVPLSCNHLPLSFHYLPNETTARRMEPDGRGSASGGLRNEHGLH